MWYFLDDINCYCIVHKLQEHYNFNYQKVKQIYHKYLLCPEVGQKYIEKQSTPIQFYKINKSPLMTEKVHR